jgi:hypothetical protein
LSTQQATRQSLAAGWAGVPHFIEKETELFFFCRKRTNTTFAPERRLQARVTIDLRCGKTTATARYNGP